MTFEDEKRLRTVISNPVYGSLLGMKKFKVNEEVIFEGTANTISWEDRLIGKKTLAEIREIARDEGLDYVLMHSNPVTVRIMNFENFMFKGNKIKEGLGKRSKLNKGKLFMLDAYSESETIEAAAASALEASKHPGLVAIEVLIMSRSDSEQINRSMSVVERVESLLDRIGKGKLRLERKDLGALIRINVKAQLIEEESKDLLEEMKEFSDPDEETMVQEFINSSGTLESSEFKMIDEFKGSGIQNEQVPINPELIQKMPEGPAKRKMMEESLKRALGGKLASSMMKGKIKPN